MTTQDMDFLARKIVSLEKRHNALARAQQLPNSSVRLVDGDDVGLAESAEATKDIGDEAAYLGDWLTGADNNLDDNAEYGVEVPEWIQYAAHGGDVAWDSTQFATDLALTLDTELTQAKQELEQAQFDLTQALADSATALQEAQEALQEAEAAVTAVNAATAAASAAEAAAQAAQTAAGTAQTAADQAAVDALAAANAASGAQDAADDAQTTADAKGKVIIQSDAPNAADRLPQNLWIDTTSGNNTPKRWDGSGWVEVTDKAATDAAAAAATAQNRADSAFVEATAAATTAGNAMTAANSKNTVWYQNTTPTGTGHKVGDTWFKTDEGNKIHHWDGSIWAPAELGTDAIENLSITNALIANGTIQNAKIANLDAAKITTGFLAAARIEAGTIVADKLAANAVTAEKIAADAVVADKIASNAVTAVKINANAVTADKIAADAVIADKIAADAVTADKIAANAITAGKIATNAVTADKIEANAVTAAKISGGSFAGKTFTGGTFTGTLIRTAASGQRVQFDSSGLRTYNASNTVTSTLYADGSGMFISGGFGVTSTDSNSRIWIQKSSEASGTGITLQGGSVNTRERSSTIQLDPRNAGTGQNSKITLSAGSIVLDSGSVDMPGDTNWANFTRASGVTGVARWRRKGGIIYVDVSATNTVVNNGALQVGTLPVAARPTSVTAISVYGSGISSGVVGVDTLGVIRYRNTSGSTVTTYDINGSWISS